jgi:hypothetical protein
MIMPTAFLLRADFTCAVHHAPPSRSAITAPVGDAARCKNLLDDTKFVQNALNTFEVVDGGPAPKLRPDGICGPLTKAAILQFQKKWFDATAGSRDGVVDPDKHTEHRLRLGPGTPATPASQFLENRARVVEILTAAQAALTLAKTHFDLSDVKIGDAALAMVEKHFHIGKSAEPRAQLERIELMLLNMQRAIGFVPQGRILLTDEPAKLALGTFMYAFGGGIRLNRPKDSFDGFRMDTIYLCPRSRLLSGDSFVYALIHELAHYVGPDDSNDFAYFHIDPQAYGRLTPAQAFLNADSYAQFAFEAAGKPNFDLSP